ncbi:ATP phosphoribosyltransferase regulatory subunit [Paenibacillus dauci]|uniref:ATP phosphoribosyltransferase regulatory subunit n=1 Tax=Paenibacillus dauci TaxID=1567106 RepID=UPI000619FE18|nr:ATP phosphoribosyltransferase regulatory subunit [Paenibacillus dauci]
MQNVKGTHDFIGEEQRLRRSIRNLLERQFELYSYEEADTTILNEMDWLISKYGGGEEIVKEMYQLSDQRQRALGLRYDLTMPLAKLMALNPGIRLPYRRFEMGKVFRDGPTKRGRLREFWQCDADIIGLAGPEAELELFQLALQTFAQLEIPVVLKWNNRRFLSEVLGALGVPSGMLSSVMLTLDKLAKITIAEVATELQDKLLPAPAITALLELIGRPTEQLEMNSIGRMYNLTEAPGYLEVQQLQQLLGQLPFLRQQCEFDLFLSRGLSFYTGTVYELFDATGSFPSSLGSGGRYDGMIGKLTDREELELPAIGLSFGLESIMALYRERSEPAGVGEVSTSRRPAPVVIVPIGDTLPDVMNTALQLRAAGIPVQTEPGGRKLGKLLNSLYARNIRYVILLGEDEVKAQIVTLKDLEQRQEFTLALDEAVHNLTQLYL